MLRIWEAETYNAVAHSWKWIFFYWIFRGSKDQGWIQLMLDVATSSMESQMSVIFAQLFTNPSLHRRNQELIKELNTTPP
ncbi:hypothetical protein F2Q70_00027155 [Brassica cretica]|uniref:Uncharacterized protein n=1 Tax=Brassica cretica TaxID=69181 RepID=A0A8S9I9D5_BRACR|nr:hypothetical protein F2Q68_00026691 [Brassica cretica]KAF2602096.1 hypothetical protein F2Q70_00027155 [Brassica cretica]